MGNTQFLGIRTLVNILFRLERDLTDLKSKVKQITLDVIPKSRLFL